MSYILKIHTWIVWTCNILLRLIFPWHDAYWSCQRFCCLVGGSEEEGAELTEKVEDDGEEEEQRMGAALLVAVWGGSNWKGVEEGCNDGGRFVR